MKFSVITPTFNRESYLIRLYAYFKAQTYPDKELLIWDDSPEPSPFFSRLEDEEVWYIHQPQRITVGEKRNYLVERASGDYIAHFDDDDFYAPTYLETMARHLAEHDFVKLGAWYLYSERHDFWGYFDAESPSPVHYHLRNNGTIRRIEDYQTDLSMLWGYGFSFAYRREMMNSIGFEPLNNGEDVNLVREKLLNSGFRLHHFADTEGIALHILNPMNAGEVYPQYRLFQEHVPPMLWIPVTDVTKPLAAIGTLEQKARIA